LWDKSEVTVATSGSVIGKSLPKKNLFPSVINFMIQDEAGRDTHHAQTTV